MASMGEVVVLRHARAALPQRFRRAKESVDGCNFGGGRRSPGGPYVQLIRWHSDQFVDPDRARFELRGA